MTAWAIFAAVLTQVLHLALILAATPLVIGSTRWLKARMMGRRGAHPLQPWRDTVKLLRKRPLLAENASWMSRAAPFKLSVVILWMKLGMSIAVGQAVTHGASSHCCSKTEPRTHFITTSSLTGSSGIQKLSLCRPSVQ